MANESPAAVLVTKDGDIVTGISKAGGQEVYVVMRDTKTLEVLEAILDELRELKERVDIILDN